MTELERARAHLRTAQAGLGNCRRYGGCEPWYERNVLAALSWVWFEQEMVGAINLPRLAGIRSYSYEHGRLS